MGGGPNGHTHTHRSPSGYTRTKNSFPLLGGYKARGATPRQGLTLALVLACEGVNDYAKSLARPVSFT